jgi:hypothetical protein
MMPLTYVRPEPVLLKGNPELDEPWVRDRIVEDPSILGLGDLEVKDVERIHPGAGRLDLLLRDPDTGKRYEVELQLGAVDESHIIRTIEYWDIERKRYPQYDHCAVIVAEGITARFLNVIGLFAGSIPLVAIQMQAYQLGGQVFLTFTKVLDELVLGDEDEDEEAAQPVDRTYWEQKASKESIGIADACGAILKEVQATLSLRFVKNYVGVAEGSRANNFVIFRPKRNFVRIEVRIVDQATWKTRLEEAGLVVLESEKPRKRMRLRVTASDVADQREVLRDLFQAAYKEQHE